AAVPVDVAHLFLCRIPEIEGFKERAGQVPAKPQEENYSKNPSIHGGDPSRSKGSKTIGARRPRRPCVLMRKHYCLVITTASRSPRLPPPPPRPPPPAPSGRRPPPPCPRC